MKSSTQTGANSGTLQIQALRGTSLACQDFRVLIHGALIDPLFSAGTSTTRAWLIATPAARSHVVRHPAPFERVAALAAIDAAVYARCRQKVAVRTFMVVTLRKLTGNGHRCLDRMNDAVRVVRNRSAMSPRRTALVLETSKQA